MYNKEKSEDSKSKLSINRMDWSDYTVLVTGAGGFIGSHLVERLVELGAKTRALIRYNSGGFRGWLENSDKRKEIEFYWGDIRDIDSLRPPLKGVNVLFHLG